MEKRTFGNPACHVLLTMINLIDSEYVHIYLSNLSPYYIVSCVFTLIALASTWWFRNRTDKEELPLGSSRSKELSTKRVQQDESDREIDVPQEETESSSKDELPDAALKDVNLVDMETKRLAAEHIFSEQYLMRRLKTAQHLAIKKKLSAGLTDEQLAREQKEQAKQLEAIFSLLKQQEEQFNIRTMDELQEQLKLYRV